MERAWLDSALMTIANNLRDIRDQQDIISCSDDRDDVCSKFDIAIDQLESLRTEFDSYGR